MSEPDPFDYLPAFVESDASGHLDVGDGHRVWWEASGPQDALPVILLHGGPGGATRPVHRRFFDPDKFRYVTLHQRGCGKSTPLASVEHNNTQALIADIEKVREHLGIDRWLIVGGSWGTALGVAYGEAHPESCLGFVLFGVTLSRDEERYWWWHGTSKLFPEAYDAMLEHLPPEERDDPQAAFYRRLIDPDPAVHHPAALAICLYSAATTSVSGTASAAALYQDKQVALTLARLALHYFSNKHFFEPGQLLRDLHRITHLPCAILNGRYDVTTPVSAAWALHKAWPGSSYRVQPEGSHGLIDRGMGMAFHDTLNAMHARLTGTAA